MVKAWDISTGICRISSQTPAKYYAKRDAQLINGRPIFTWYMDKRSIHGMLRMERLYGKWMDLGTMWRSLRISGDGLRIFGLYPPSLWAWSLQTGEVVGRVEIGYYGPWGSLIVDGSKVWAWDGSNYKGWDFSTLGSSPVKLSNKPPLSSPSTVWDPEHARIKNPASGEVVFQLSGRFSNPVHVQCDDSYLVAGYQSGEILILDLRNVK
jgi:hypothetical protein